MHICVPMRGLENSSHPRGSATVVRWLTLCLFVFANLALAEDRFVSPAGNDGNDGRTQQTALRSLAAACRAIPAGKNTIHIAAGEYSETQSSVLAPGVSIAGGGVGKTVIHWGATRDLERDPLGADQSAFLIQMKDSADAYISGLSIVGGLPGDKRAHGGIVAHKVRNVSIHDCELRGLEFTGVWLSAAENSSVYTCFFEDCGHPHSESCSGALQLGDLTDCAIYRNVIRESRGAYGIKTCKPEWVNNPSPWTIKVKLDHLSIHGNFIHVRQQSGWGNGQPNMAIELWNSDPTACEMYFNRVNEGVSVTGNAHRANTFRIHHNTFFLEPGYSYAIEAGNDGLEIDHNIFRHGYYPIACFGPTIHDLNVHHNTFDGIEEVGVVLAAGLADFRFVNNTVMVKNPMPLLCVGKFASESKNLLIADNVFVKGGTTLNSEQLVRFGQGAEVDRSAYTVRGNVFWNWDAQGESAMTVDPMLVRDPWGAHLLHMALKSPALAAGKGNVPPPCPPATKPAK